MELLYSFNMLFMDFQYFYEHDDVLFCYLVEN